MSSRGAVLGVGQVDDAVGPRPTSSSRLRVNRHWTPAGSLVYTGTTNVGDDVDVFELTHAVKDGATVKVYHEPRLARVQFPMEPLGEFDEALSTATSGTENEAGGEAEIPMGESRGDHRL